MRVKGKRPADGTPRRRVGRPTMAETPSKRARNKRWLFGLMRGELTIGEIMAEEDVSRKQIRRALADAATYPEIGERVRELAAALGYSAGAGELAAALT